MDASPWRSLGTLISGDIHCTTLRSDCPIARLVLYHGCVTMANLRDAHLRIYTLHDIQARPPDLPIKVTPWMRHHGRARQNGKMSKRQNVSTSGRQHVSLGRISYQSQYCPSSKPNIPQKPILGQKIRSDHWEGSELRKTAVLDHAEPSHGHFLFSVPVVLVFV